MGIDREFWAGKRIFLTGHTGFKGAWLSLWLTRLGAKVVGYSLDPPTEPNFFGVARVSDRLTGHYHADILDLAKLQEAIAESEPDIIYHLAAQSLVRVSYQDPVYTYAANVMGTVHVLEASRCAPSVKVVAVITSDKCYENKESNVPYRESDPVGGHDPYSSSKACAELVTASYRASFSSQSEGKIRIASVRAGNVIGGGDWASDRLIPDCVRAFSQRRPVVLRYPQAVRPWQHVLEPLAGYLILVERLLGEHGSRFAASWNFGPDPAAEATVREVASAVAKHWGEGAEVQLEPTPANCHEAGLLRLDSTAARVKLGWTPRWPLARSLEETVGWYRAWQNGQDMQLYSTAQIENYSRDTA